MFFRYFVIYFLIKAVQLAPVDEKTTGSLFDIVNNDSRAATLRDKRFFKFECSKETVESESICIALYDLAIKFNNSQLNFTTSPIQADSEFCSHLLDSLPDQPSFDESTSANIKTNYKHEVTWIKDVFKQKNGKKCLDECTYKFSDYGEEELKVKPGKYQLDVIIALYKKNHVKNNCKFPFILFSLLLHLQSIQVPGIAEHQTTTTTAT